jgi:hypothetical protein
MSDHFTDLRERLEQDAVQPPFAEIMTRRVRRTQRYAATLVAGALAVIVLAAGVTVGIARGSASGPVPAGPPSVSTAATGAPDTADRPVEVLAATTSGTTLYVLTRHCLGGCAGAGNRPVPPLVLSSSTNYGGDWNRRELSVDNADGVVNLWVGADGTAWVARPGAGRWDSFRLAAGVHEFNPDPLPTADGPAFGGIAGAGGWIGWGRVLLRINEVGGLATPMRLPVPGSDPLRALLVLSPATALLATGDGTSLHWYLTDDHGKHFEPVGDPCAGSRFPGTPWVSGAVAGAGGTQPFAWLTCAGQPSAGQQPKQIFTSQDLTRWDELTAPVENSGYATTLVPFLTGDLWRYGPRADVYRINDSAHWRAVAPTAQQDGPLAFAAPDLFHAVYLARDDRNVLRCYRTGDGGAHWTSAPFTA